MVENVPEGEHVSHRHFGGTVRHNAAPPGTFCEVPQVRLDILNDWDRWRDKLQEISALVCPMSMDHVLLESAAHDKFAGPHNYGHDDNDCEGGGSPICLCRRVCSVS